MFAGILINFLAHLKKLVVLSKWLMLGFVKFTSFPGTGKYIRIFNHDDTARLRIHLTGNHVFSETGSSVRVKNLGFVKDAA